MSSEATLRLIISNTVNLIYSTLPVPDNLELAKFFPATSFIYIYVVSFETHITLFYEKKKRLPFPYSESK